MAKRKKTKKQIEQYEHSNKKRANNPPVGLVTPKSDPNTGEKKTYGYNPHLDPQLQWAGKAEHTSFEVPTVSLYVHERIDPKTIIDKHRYMVIETKGKDSQQNQTKREYLNEWIKAVNEQGGFGKWHWDVSFEPSDIESKVRKCIKNTPSPSVA